MAAIMPASGWWFPTARGGGLGADQQLAPSTYIKLARQETQSTGKMDSTTLRELGFGPWAPISSREEARLLEALPVSCGVYAFLLAQSMARRLGTSDIAYIGKATNQNGLRGRVRQYFHPGPSQSTNIAMRRRLDAADCSLLLSFVASASAIVAARLEADLLAQFKAEHAELPPYNRQQPVVAPWPSADLGIQPARPRPTGRAVFRLAGFDQGGVRGPASNLRLVCFIDGGGKLAVWGRQGASGNIDRVLSSGPRCSVDCEFREPSASHRKEYGHTHWVHETFALSIVPKND